jgi:hypothetical protein
MAPILEVRNATKRFPGVLANDRISFSLNQGEILAFLGENGAGKSTLMNILYGLYEPDEGEIEIRGKKADIQDPNDAIGLGIGMVHQHFQLVPVFTVAENIVMGAEPTRPSFSWRSVGLVGAGAAVLFLVGSIFALDNVAQWLVAGLAGGAAVGGILALVMLLGWLTKLGFRLYFPITALGSVALLVALALILGRAGQIPLLVFVALLFAAASFPALEVLTTAITGARQQRASVNCRSSTAWPWTPTQLLRISQ